MQREAINLDGGKSGVVLVHGVTGSPLELKYLAKELNSAGYTVKVPCLAGHEGDINKLKKTSWQDWYGTIENTINELDKRCDEIFVGGLCIGALLSLHAAYLFGSKIKAVALLSTTLRYDGWGIPFPWFAIALNSTPLRYFISYPDTKVCGIKNERLRKVILQGMKENTIAYYRMPGTTMHEFRRLSKVIEKELPDIKAPTLMIHSKEDDVASMKNVEIVENKIGSAVVHKVILDNCYHMIALDNQRDIVAKEMVAFFNRFRNRGAINNVETISEVSAF
jgi:carboxylesterase